MNRRLLGAGVLLTAFLALPALDALAQKKKKDDKPVATATDASKLTGNEFIGLLKTIPGSTREFTLEVEGKKLVATGKGGGGKAGGGNTGLTRVLQAQQRLAQAQQAVAAARTPQARQQAANRVRQAAQQLQQAMASLNGAGGKAGGAPPGYKYETTKTLVEFQLSEKGKIRTMLPPDGGFDEKGNPKKYTAKELSEMRGKDKGLPGFEASVEKMEVGQKVRVVQAAAPAKKTEEKDKDKDDEMKADKTKQVKLVVILEEAAAGAGAGKGKKK